MRLFGKKKPEVQESSYEIFGGATIRKINEHHEITWKGSHPMSLTVSSMPEIDQNVKMEREDSTIRITSPQCKLRVITKGGGMNAFISEL